MPKTSESSLIDKHNLSLTFLRYSPRFKISISPLPNNSHSIDILGILSSTDCTTDTLGSFPLWKSELKVVCGTPISSANFLSEIER